MVRKLIENISSAERLAAVHLKVNWAGFVLS
jgi:hypothetical protein